MKFTFELLMHFYTDDLQISKCKLTRKSDHIEEQYFFTIETEVGK